MAQARRSKAPVLLSSIGATLKEERLSMGMTQIEAARQFSISLKSLRNLEQGQGGVPLSTATKILAFFGKELRVGDIAMSPQHHKKTRPRKEVILETLKLMTPVLRKKFGIKNIALFGSCARDEATKNSDIDLAVTFNAETNFETVGQVVVLLETLFEGQKVDLVELREMIPEIRAQAEKDFINVL